MGGNNSRSHKVYTDAINNVLETDNIKANDNDVKRLNWSNDRTCNALFVKKHDIIRYDCKAKNAIDNVIVMQEKKLTCIAENSKKMYDSIVNGRSLQ